MSGFHMSNQVLRSGIEEMTFWTLHTIDLPFCCLNVPLELNSSGSSGDLANLLPVFDRRQQPLCLLVDERDDRRLVADGDGGGVRDAVGLLGVCWHLRVHPRRQQIEISVRRFFFGL